MNDLHLSKEEFEKLKEDVQRKMTEYTTMPEGESKRIVYLEAHNLIIWAADYYFRNYNYSHQRMDDFYDRFYAMTERALRRYTPEKGLFWNYFNNGLKKMALEIVKKENEEESKEGHLVGDDEYHNAYRKGTVRESSIAEEESAEEIFLKELEREKKVKQEMQKQKAIVITFLKVANDMIGIKESILTSKVNTPRYYSAFYTGKIVEILKNAGLKDSDISDEETRVVLKGEEAKVFEGMDVELLDFTYTTKPLDIDAIADNELKKNKDILGDNCFKPEEELRVPFGVKNVYLPYFRDVQRVSKVSEQSISSQKKKYYVLMGEYMPKELLEQF